MSEADSLSDTGSLDVQTGDASDEAAMRLVVSFVNLSGEAAGADFEFVGRDDSRSVGCLFGHLRLHRDDRWRIVVNNCLMTEYTPCTMLWTEVVKPGRDQVSNHMLTVTVMDARQGKAA